MRKNNRSKNRYFLIFFIIIVLYLNVKGEQNLVDKELLIEVQDEVYEGKNFSISLYSFENGTISYPINFTIIFNNRSYFFPNNDLDIELLAPNVTEDTLFEIKAIKIGYNEAISYILILNDDTEKSQLFITILDNDFIIKGDTYITILITDQTGAKIPDAMVAFQGYIGKDSFSTTDNGGLARILVPNDRDEIILIVQKVGYINGFEKILIDTNQDLFINLINNQFLIILFAVIILISSIIFVSKRKNNNKEKFELVLEKNNIKDNTSLKKHDLSNNNEHIRESKIEEIRINKNNSDKKISNLNINKRKINKNLSSNKKNDQFYLGLDEIRYKIDQMQEMNKKDSSNKWFEGKENIKAKVDKKIKDKKYLK